MQGYRVEVRRNYEEFEQAFAADMKWRDSWVEAKRDQRREDRRGTGKTRHRGDSSRVAPAREDGVSHPGDTDHFDRIDAVDEEEGRGVISCGPTGEATETDATCEQGCTDAVSIVRPQPEPPNVTDEEATEGAAQKDLAGENVNGGPEGAAVSEKVNGEVRGPCQGSRLLKAPQALENSPIIEGGVEGVLLGSSEEDLERREETKCLDGQG